MVLNFTSDRIMALKINTQPVIILAVKTSFRKMQEKITPKTDSNDKNKDAIVVGVYF